MKKYLLLLLSASCSLFASAQVNLFNGLVACYPFDGNANDMSGNNHNGTVFGPVLTTDRFGNPSSAYLYNGISDYINLGHYGNIIPTSDEFSLSVWLQASVIDIQTILMINPDDFNDRFNACVDYDHNGTPSTFWDYGNASSGGRLQIIGTPFSSNWEHYVFIVSASQNYMEVYKNDVLQFHQNSSSTLVNRNRDLRIGGAIDVNNAQFFFNGKIDDMRLYDRVLNASEIQTLYSQNISCSTTSVNNLNHSYDISLFPTLSDDGLLQLSLGELSKDFSIEIFNDLGQKIKSMKQSGVSGTLKLNFSEFSKGVYFLELSNSDFRKNFKFIIE